MKKTLGQIALHVTRLDVMEDFYKNTVGLTHLFTVPNRLSFFDLGGVERPKNILFDFMCVIY